MAVNHDRVGLYSHPLTCGACCGTARNQSQSRGLQMTRLRYEGKYDWIKDEDARQWTIISDFYDKNGHNRKAGTFGLESLKNIGVIE